MALKHLVIFGLVFVCLLALFVPSCSDDKHVSHKERNPDKFNENTRNQNEKKKEKHFNRRGNRKRKRIKKKYRKKTGNTTRMDNADEFTENTRNQNEKKKEKHFNKRGNRKRKKIKKIYRKKTGNATRMDYAVRELKHIIDEKEAIIKHKEATIINLEATIRRNEAEIQRNEAEIQRKEAIIQNQLNCPIDGKWSSFSEFGQCSATCGQGIKERTRTCSNPPPQHGGLQCQGRAKETENCVLVDNCPVPGGWSNFTDWSTCSQTCGNGTNVRSRTCTQPQPQFGGEYCDGEETQTENCFLIENCREKKITIAEDLEVADICCFIIITKSNEIWILTDHIFRDLDFNSTCQMSQCAYSPYENSPTLHTTKQKCLSEFGEEYTCCSEHTGAFCEDYSGNSTGIGKPTKNIKSGGCSEECKKIADCSVDPENEWCQNVKVKVYEEENDPKEEHADYIPHTLYQELIDHSHLTDDEKEYHCEFHSPCPHHPKSLPFIWSHANETGCYTCSHRFHINVSQHSKYSKFRKTVRFGFIPTFIPHRPRFNRVKRQATALKPGDEGYKGATVVGTVSPTRAFSSCHSVYFWKFKCSHCRQYAKYPTRQNYYKKEETEKYFKDGCCPGMQPLCITNKKKACPSFPLTTTPKY